MWRCFEQLVGKLRGSQSVRGAGSMRATRLAIETLENRTVLSANFGVDYEAVAYHDFSAPPTPRLFVDHETVAALGAAFAEDGPVAFAEDRVPPAFGEDASFVLIISFRPDHRAMDSNYWATSKPPLSLAMGGGRTSLSYASWSPEDGLAASSGAGDKGPLRIQTPVNANVDSGNSNGKAALMNNFDPPQPPDLGKLLDRIAEARHATTSPFLAPINDTTTSEETETDDSASLLANYATLAASIGDDDSSATNHDAAFDGYATLSDGDVDREEYLQLLAEDQTRDAAVETGGFVDLDEMSVDGAEGLSNLVAEKQSEAIESALRSLAARRGDARTSHLPENWLEQAWLSADVAQQGEANANQIADEPGGMILLQPMADGAGDELIAAGDMSEVIQTAVEMEATMGAFQAFDVSIDEASAAVVKPAPVHELGAKQDRDESSNDGVVDRQAASGLGVLAVGAMALAAKRQMDDRRRKPK
jgi:hypothetical protein